MKGKGSAFKYGDNVDTDVIIPARYLNTSVHSELAKHCMEDIDSDFAKNVKEGDKASGVSCVIAKSFARIFYRNSINIGLPILECPEACDNIESGDEVEVNFDTGKIKNLTKNMEFQGEAFPEFMQELIAAGGLAAYIKNKGDK
jgi:3-isopropylmalate/(R)-2-methylmalate dehydratase small subunit